MADKEGMERKVYLLPAELVERIKSYQTDQGITSEVEAARRLLDAALQMRDSVRNIVEKLKANFETEKDLRVLARDVLTSHTLVVEIQLNDNDVTFRMRNGDCGRIDREGRIYSGDAMEYLIEIREIPKPIARTAARVASGGPSWDAQKGGDLDDEIPF